jgi:2-methylcitrate dehydratase
LLAHAIRTTDAPSPMAIEQAKLLLLDTIGCAFAGRAEPMAQAVLNASANSGTCAVIGQSARTSLLNAVFINGVLVRVLDLNDYFIGNSHGEPESAGHPSDNIPVALAVGSARERSGREILAAIAIGYELYARLQQALDRTSGWDGVTASGLVAPAIAGLLMELSELQLAHALALGAARAATPSIVRSGEISAAKSFANGLVAQSGVQAALLAEQGATGPLAILDDARGLRDVFTRANPASLCAPFLRDGAIMRAHVKAYPCINTGQSAVAAALKLHELIGRTAADLPRIEVIMADYMVTKRHQDDPERRDPCSRETADHSFPFIVAVALLDGRFGADQFQGERWRDDDVRGLMSKIVMRRDATWNARAPGSFPCSIVTVDHHGRECRVEVDYPPGYSRSRLEPTIVVDKFHAVTEPYLSGAESARIVDSVMEFDQCRSADTLNAATAIEGTAK